MEKKQNVYVAWLLEDVDLLILHIHFSLKHKNLSLEYRDHSEFPGIENKNQLKWFLQNFHIIN